MMRSTGLVALLAGALVLGGCGGDANRESGLRLMHAAPDAPPVNLLINDVTVRSGIDYGQGTRLLLVGSGSYALDIDGIGPEGRIKLLDAPLNRGLASGMDYTLVVVGSIANSSLQVLELSGLRGDVPDGLTELRLLHAIEGFGAVDVYLTEPDAELAASMPAASLSGYLDDSGALRVEAGTRQLRISTAGNPGELLFDAGNINLAPNARLFIVALASTTPAGSPLVLAINTGGTQGELRDRATPGLVRSVHLSPDTGPLDIEAREGLAEGDPTTALVSGLEFASASPYQALPPGQYQLRATGSLLDPEEESPGVLVEFIQGIQPAQSLSFFITGPGEQALQRLLQDRRRPVATESRLRILHASVDAGLVDVYVKRPGQALSDALLIFRSVSLRAETGQRLLPPDEEYLVVVTAAGDSTQRRLEIPLTLSAGDVRTLVVRDPPGGGEPLAFTLLDDRAELPLVP
ncbi:MAG: DUF4397 domain-containing protein [Chromatiales bacterium]|nr:DUF4397 domain-containing protein [Chromatiales bacterium]